ncbi:MAG: hypothetical protein SFV23_26990 [Planctomycetaceae bacterium]|nr:hypothetical protein [Planctomycetaceae bacterium]
MVPAVTVRTGARLHFGLLAVKPLHGRKFGGVGVMVEQPGFEICLRAASVDSINGGTSSTLLRIREFLTRVRGVSQADLPPVEMVIRREIPSHEGLGSGTQLGLAVTAGLQFLATGARSRAAQLAAGVGRGARSAIGVHGFDEGGFLIEAGHQTEADISPLVARAVVPTAWRWLLISPRESAGLSGAAEQQAFRQLPSMPESLTSTLCRILLMDWLPAMLAADFAVSASAMWEYGQRVGEFFTCVQGNRFAHPRMAALAETLRRRGISGIAQTSWGPTIAVLCPDPEHASELQHWISTQQGEEGLSTRITASRNTGAEVVAQEWEPPIPTLGVEDRQSRLRSNHG